MAEEHNHNHEEENIIWITNEEGKEEAYEILFDFDSEDFDKSYVLYSQLAKGKTKKSKSLHLAISKMKKANKVNLNQLKQMKNGI